MTAAPGRFTAAKFRGYAAAKQVHGKQALEFYLPFTSVISSGQSSFLSIPVTSNS
jgi:hypothetical protein